MNKILFSSILLGVVACSNTNTTSPYQYPETKELSYTPLITDEPLVLKPLAIEVFDSIVITWDPYEEFHFSVINAKNNTLLFKGGSKGQGPDEFLYPVILDKVSDHVLQIVDCAARKVSLFKVSDILDNKSFKAYQIIKYSDMDSNLKEGEYIDFLYYVNDHTLVAVGYFHTSKYALFHLDKNSVDYIFDFPEDNRHNHIKEPRISKYTAYQGILHFNPSRNTILYHSPLAFYYEVFEIDNPLKMLSSYFEPVDYSPGSDGRAAMSADNKSGIIWGDLSDTKTYLLYAGRTNAEYGSDTYLSDQIFVLNHQGKKLVKHHLDRDVLSFVVDDTQQKIYAIVINPDSEQFEIGYFKM